MAGAAPCLFSRVPPPLIFDEESLQIVATSGAGASSVCK